MVKTKKKETSSKVALKKSFGAPATFGEGLADKLAKLAGFESAVNKKEKK